MHCLFSIDYNLILDMCSHLIILIEMNNKKHNLKLVQLLQNVLVCSSVYSSCMHSFLLHNPCKKKLVKWTIDHFDFCMMMILTIIEPFLCTKHCLSTLLELTNLPFISSWCGRQCHDYSPSANEEDEHRKISNLLKVLQVVLEKARIQTQAVQFLLCWLVDKNEHVY